MSSSLYLGPCTFLVVFSVGNSAPSRGVSVLFNLTLVEFHQRFGGTRFFEFVWETFCSTRLYDVRERVLQHEYKYCVAIAQLFLSFLGQTTESGIPPPFRATVRYSRIHLGF